LRVVDFVWLEGFGSIASIIFIFGANVVFGWLKKDLEESKSKKKEDISHSRKREQGVIYGLYDNKRYHISNDQ